MAEDIRGDRDLHRKAVRDWVGNPNPMVDDVALSEVAYCFNELSLWTEADGLCPFDIITCWRIVEATRAKRFPNDLRM